MRAPMFLVSLALLATLSACGGKPEEAEKTAPAASEAAAPTTTEGATAAFDINKIPVSNAPLGAFPYFSRPAGYNAMGGERTVDFAQFPFWTGQRFEMVEGRVFMGGINGGEGKTFSKLEVQRNLEHLVTQAGGVKVAEGRIPTSASDPLPDDIKVGMLLGLGDIYNDPAATYVIRRPDRNIWIHFVANSLFASWAIAETKPLEITATLLPPEQLKSQIDRDGKVAIQVNFATAKADILPDSQGQIDAVVALMQQTPGLRLSVDGHTDNIGTPATNRTLSEARARSVVAALTARGVAADRLRAQGFGQDKPVADNGAEDGRARNRRVELVKI
jgi:outer membrane protein OmpA-like peptidoglycan-associated protein